VLRLQLYKPTPKQEEFLRAKTKYVAYGGSRGGGKSYAVRLKATLMALKYTGIKMLLLRRTYPELLENHMRIMALDLAQVAKYKDSDKTLNFVNGSRINFGYCDSDADLARYQGQEYDVIFMDEATQFSEYQFQVLRACLRGVNDFPKRFYLTCNPGGPGHEWVKRLFIDRVYRDGENPDDYTFIRSTVYDNAPLMRQNPGYVEQLQSLSDDLRRAWLEGDWDLYAGQYFTEFRREIHVIEPFEVPSWWRIYRAFDYGLDMLACLWAAFDDSGNCYIIRELCEPDLIVSEAAKRIKEMSPEPVYETLAPPDLWNRQKDTGRSMWELFEDNGVKLTRADANRVQGWINVKEWLKPVPSPDGDGMTARLKIFSNCAELIRCLPALQRDAKNPTDCATVPHEITHVCVSGDTRIYTDKGLVPIKELTSGMCYCYDGNGITLAPFDSVTLTRENAEVYEVVLSNGAKFKATANHKVLTADGWKMVCELTSDDNVLEFDVEGIDDCCRD
jgi:phage terminase large subunit